LECGDNDAALYSGQGMHDMRENQSAADGGAIHNAKALPMAAQTIIHSHATN
jgi:hypothetical protein